MDREKLREMIGQMIMIGFRGTTVTKNDDIIKDLHNLNIGGIILFDCDVQTGSKARNIANRDQVKELTHSLENIAKNNLFIAIDQEGGNVTRLNPKNGYKKSQTAQKLGIINNIELIRSTSKLIANQLATSGFNLNLAPVLDLNINKNNPIIGKLGRSISDDPQKVINYAEIFIQEHSKVNILSCVKHFMGHGSSEGDTHLGIVDVTETYDENELVPYSELIKKGSIDMIMTAHVYNRNIDNLYPFTLSKKVITDILRDNIGFNGVVISDDMQMGAITESYGFEDAVVLAVKAGIDIVLIPNNLIYDPQTHTKAINTIYDSVDNKIIPFKRIEESYNRITMLKQKIRIGK